MTTQFGSRDGSRNRGYEQSPHQVRNRGQDVIPPRQLRGVLLMVRVDRGIDDNHDDLWLYDLHPTTFATRRQAWFPRQFPPGSVQFSTVDYIVDLGWQQFVHPEPGHITWVPHRIQWPHINYWEAVLDRPLPSVFMNDVINVGSGVYLNDYPPVPMGNRSGCYALVSVTAPAWRAWLWQGYIAPDTQSDQPQPTPVRALDWWYTAGWYEHYEIDPMTLAAAEIGKGGDYAFIDPAGIGRKGYARVARDKVAWPPPGQVLQKHNIEFSGSAPWTVPGVFSGSDVVEFYDDYGIGNIEWGRENVPLADVPMAFGDYISQFHTVPNNVVKRFSPDTLGQLDTLPVNFSQTGVPFITGGGGDDFMALIQFIFRNEPSAYKFSVFDCRAGGIVAEGYNNTIMGMEAARQTFTIVGACAW